MALGNNQYVVTGDGTEFFMEAYTSPPQVILVGGGHVSKAISPLVHNLGFRVTVTDDRSEFANKERFSEAENVLVADPEEAFNRLKVNKNTDQVCKSCLGTDPVGWGSRSHTTGSGPLRDDARTTPACHPAQVGLGPVFFLLFFQKKEISIFHFSFFFALPPHSSL